MQLNGHGIIVFNIQFLWHCSGNRKPSLWWGTEAAAGDTATYSSICGRATSTWSRTPHTWNGTDWATTCKTPQPKKKLAPEYCVIRKIDYQEIDDCTSTPPPEQKEFSPSADNSDEASAQPRKPHKSWITPFTSQSYMYEALPESAENPLTIPAKSRMKVSTSKLPKPELGTDDRQQETIILEDEAEDEAQWQCDTDCVQL